MPVSFGGIPLTPPSGAQEIVSRWWHGHRVDEFEHPGAWAPNLAGNSPWGLPVPQPPRREPPRIGVWHCPTDMHRWGICHLLATDAQLAAIRKFAANPVLPDGSTPGGQGGPNGAPLNLLVMTDGAGNTIQDYMWCLSPRPIAQRGAGKDLYLLTFVDDRFTFQFPQFQNNGAFDPAAPPTWLSLLQAFHFLYTNILPESDPINGAYGLPQVARWLPQWRGILQPGGNWFFTPAVLDALLRTIGQRYVYQGHFNYATQSFATAYAADTSRWGEWSKQVLAGGQLTAQDASWSVPYAVNVQFMGPNYGTVRNSWVAVFLGPAKGSSFGTPVLNLSQYGVQRGIIPDAAEDGFLLGPAGQIVADMPLLSTTVAQQRAYAIQAATDYYLWALSRTDATFRGIVPVFPNGLDDCVEWCHLENEIVTRVMRRPLSDRNLYGASAPWQWPRLVENVCLSTTSSSGFLTSADITIKYLEPDGTVDCVTDPTDCCTTSWDCYQGVCTERYDNLGLYASQALCLAAGCGTSFNCVNGTCVEVFGSGGKYATLAACIASPCVTSFNCVSGNCVQVVGSGGTYATLAACIAGCITSYNCVAGSCVQVVGAGGTYPTLAACQAACGITSYNCVAGSCVSVAGGGGEYATLALCQAGCTSPPPPCDCTAFAAPVLTITGPCIAINGNYTLTNLGGGNYSYDNPSPGNHINSIRASCSANGSSWTVSGIYCFGCPSGNGTFSGTVTGSCPPLDCTATCAVTGGPCNGQTITLTLTGS